jgi:hypothetical protein
MQMRPHLVCEENRTHAPPSGVERGMRGWGGRIRTSEWRNQNPLPYHLATPQSGTYPVNRPGPPGT